jgi:hypothetical protein
MASTRLCYPENLGAGGTRDYIKFEFGEYKAPYSTGETQYNSSFYDTKTGFDPKGTPIYLNMPDDIGSSFNGKWAGKDLTGVAAFGLGTVAGPIATGLKGDLDALQTQFANIFNLDTIKNAGGAATEDGLKFLGDGFGQLPGLGANLGVNDILALSAGTIINPNTELLYSGSSLRTHGYTFKLIPQTKTEAQNVIKIVEAFKKACAPKSKPALFGGAFKNFIGIPDICRISFMGDGGENPYLPRYKPSAITAVSVNYVTDGGYISFRDGEPVGVSLTVALTELKLIYDNEIGSGPTQYR